MLALAILSNYEMFNKLFKVRRERERVRENERSTFFQNKSKSGDEDYTSTNFKNYFIGHSALPSTSRMNQTNVNPGSTFLTCCFARYMPNLGKERGCFLF